MNRTARAGSPPHRADTAGPYAPAPLPPAGCAPLRAATPPDRSPGRLTTARTTTPRKA
ncbi:MULTISPECIES: hypothetical protein [Streptomyces]|uniref:hypothetical protein n=1 Tax=Streptomyces TaxID=1883 RepID=UPI000B25C376|nr:hypothetical protein [Streptomyces durhamensis]